MKTGMSAYGNADMAKNITSNNTDMPVFILDVSSYNSFGADYRILSKCLLNGNIPYGDSSAVVTNCHGADR